METKELSFKGITLSGFLMLVLVIAGYLLGIYLIILSISMLSGWIALAGILDLLFSIVFSFGFVLLEPNETKVITFFGKYSGNLRKVGFSYINPFYGGQKLTLRARNLDVPPIKVNDKTGNPILIGLVVVWKLKDTYKVMFEVDTRSMSSPTISASGGKPQLENVYANRLQGIMNACENFVKIQSDAALRHVAGLYAYDDPHAEETLRSAGEEVNKKLENELNERLSIAGIEAIETRINYLAYAPEIAAVMLRRQQADAIISAREKIVEGAVSMVEMALKKLSDEQIVTLDEDKKASMVSNLLVVLCADEQAQPVINTGTLYQ